jgi:hypothetical protein
LFTCSFYGQMDIEIDIIFLGEDQDEGLQTTTNGEQKENGNGKKNGDPNGSKSSDFKGHLNGLYNGLANIMTTTCDLGPDSRSQIAPFAVEKAVHNIMFIKHHMKRQDEFDAVSIFMFLFYQKTNSADVFTNLLPKFCQRIFLSIFLIDIWS